MYSEVHQANHSSSRTKLTVAKKPVIFWRPSDYPEICQDDCS